METQLEIPILRYVIERQQDIMTPDSWIPCVRPGSKELAVYVDRGEAEDMFMTAQAAAPVRLLETTLSDDALRRIRRRWGCP